MFFFFFFILFHSFLFVLRFQVDIPFFFFATCHCTFSLHHTHTVGGTFASATTTCTARVLLHTTAHTCRLIHTHSLSAHTCLPAPAGTGCLGCTIHLPSTTFACTACHPSLHTTTPFSHCLPLHTTTCLPAFCTHTATAWFLTTACCCRQAVLPARGHTYHHFVLSVRDSVSTAFLLFSHARTCTPAWIPAFHLTLFPFTHTLHYFYLLPCSLPPPMDTGTFCSTLPACHLVCTHSLLFFLYVQHSLYFIPLYTYFTARSSFTGCRVFGGVPFSLPPPLPRFLLHALPAGPLLLHYLPYHAHVWSRIPRRTPSC